MVTAKEIMQTAYPTIKADASIGALLGLMRMKHVHWAVVLDARNAYVGMTDKKWLLRSRIDVEKMKVKRCTVQVPTLETSDTAEVMLHKFIASDIKALPVFDKRKLLGIVHAFDIIDMLKPILKKVRVKELMSIPQTLPENSTLGQALNLMTQQKLHHIPIVDKKSGKLVGIVSLMDLLEKQLLFPTTRMHIPRAASHQMGRKSGFGVGEKTGLMDFPVSNILTPDCCTCSPNDLLPAVIDQMRKHTHSTSIATENSKPVGILTIKDLLVQAHKLSA